MSTPNTELVVELTDSTECIEQKVAAVAVHAAKRAREREVLVRRYVERLRRKRNINPEVLRTPVTV